MDPDEEPPEFAGLGLARMIEFLLGLAPAFYALSLGSESLMDANSQINVLIGVTIPCCVMAGFICAIKPERHGFPRLTLCAHLARISYRVTTPQGQTDESEVPQWSNHMLGVISRVL